jgi:hypothetical protein
MVALPYVTAPGNIDKALRGIKSAATPESVSQDFVKTILQVPGGSGNQATSFLKKIGFVNADGTPSDVYKRFRNSSSTGAAAAEALKIGYGPLYKRNEYMHQLSDDKLRGLIIEETGQSDESSVVSLTLACIKAIKKFADWTVPNSHEKPDVLNETQIAKPLADAPQPPPPPTSGRVGLALSYTINLNLPATSDAAVFNAIFKSLKENLLRESNE